MKNIWIKAALLALIPFILFFSLYINNPGDGNTLFSISFFYFYISMVLGGFIGMCIFMGILEFFFED